MPGAVGLSLGSLPVQIKVVVFEVLPNQWLTGITTGKTFLPVKHGKTEFLKKMCGK